MPTGLTIRAQNLAGWKKKGEKAAKIFKSRSMAVALATVVDEEMRNIIKEQFSSEGAAGGSAGKWPALESRYAARKKKLVGDKTILRFKDRIYRSLVQRGRALPKVGTTSRGFRHWYGTRVKHAQYHQEGGGPHNLPQRKIIDPSQKQFQRMLKRMERVASRKLREKPWVDKQRGKGGKVTAGAASELTRLLQLSIAKESGRV